MDGQQKAPEKPEESAAAKMNRYMTPEERREWSAAAEWHDPLDTIREPDENDGKIALASLVLGITSLVTICVTPASAAFGAAAVIAGIISKKKQESMNKMNTVGIVMGIVAIGVALALLGIWLFKKFMAPAIADGISTIPLE